jgi:hypothetical protein
MEAHTANDNGPGERSTAQLVSDLSEQTGRLVRQELELARLELTRKGRQAGFGAGLFGGAGVFGFYALGALTAAAILLLSRAVVSWLAAAIVAAALAVIAGMAGLLGGKQLARSVPPVPEQAVETVREDVEYARERAREGRQ